MKPYSPLGNVRHGGYSVAQCHGLPAVTRPTKNAAGMSYTFSRHHAFGKPSFPGVLHGESHTEVLRLVVYGTLDSLRNGKALAGLTLPKHCPCCGAITKARQLSGAGFSRLLILRARHHRRLMGVKP